MIHHRKRQVGPADLAACSLDPREGLWGGAFMYQMSVDINQAGLSWNLSHQVGFPDFVVHRSRGHGSCSLAYGSERDSVLKGIGRQASQSTDFPIEAWTNAIILHPIYAGISAAFGSTYGYSSAALGQLG